MNNIDWRLYELFRIIKNTIENTFNVLYLSLNYQKLHF